MAIIFKLLHYLEIQSFNTKICSSRPLETPVEDVIELFKHGLKWNISWAPMLETAAVEQMDPNAKHGILS